MDNTQGPARTDESAAVLDAAPVNVPRRPLDQLRIVRAAVGLIDSNGLSHFTMRRLGAHLGVEAMALYRYVPSREQLLDGVVEVVMDELYESTQTGGLSTSWQEYLRMQARAVRTLAVTHPWIFPLVAIRPPSVPWLRPPLRSLRWVESFLEGLRGYGFTPRASVAVYRSFATFLLGALLLEAGTLDDLTITDQTHAVMATDDLSSYPIVSEMAEELKEDAFETEFEAALEDLIKRVAVMRTSQAASAAG